MPNGNGTGPNGLGQMTGRGLGFCADNSVSGSANSVGGRGMGMGRGQGRGVGRGCGFGRGFGRQGAVMTPSMPTITDEQQLQNLKQQAELIQNNLSQISEQIEKLES